MIGDIAHICNRGVEKRKIFLDEQDYERFRDNLFLLNNKGGRIRTRENDVRNLKDFEREKMVEIFKWSLLPNHYHLLLFEVVDGGILEFTKRLGNAYTKYFNTKREGRSGYLFQNKARIIPIIEEPQFLYIPFYIDLNPLYLKYPNWKENRPAKPELRNFLTSYKWSSLKDYYQESGYDTLLNKELFYERFDTTYKRYEEELVDFASEATVSTCHVDTVAEFK